MFYINISSSVSIFSCKYPYEPLEFHFEQNNQLYKVDYSKPIGVRDSTGFDSLSPPSLFLDSDFQTQYFIKLRIFIRNQTYK